MAGKQHKRSIGHILGHPFRYQNGRLAPAGVHFGMEHGLYLPALQNAGFQRLAIGLRDGQHYRSRQRFPRFVRGAAPDG